jgi:Baseplate J-like protein
MAEQDIIQNLIFQLGQSQDDRLPQELEIHFADIDEQTTADLLRLTKAFSEFVNYYRNNPTTPVGNWSNFFPDDPTIEKLLNSESANTSPHLALFLAFLELYKQPQSVINNITSRHLDFYYQDVLRLQKKTAIADKVHLLLELKKNVAPVRILPEHLFSAGKDATNIELIYAPTRETVINAAKIESLRSLFFDSQGRGTIRYAPIANSSDGLGGKLAENAPQWLGFGNLNLPPAEVGFAIASPVLRMKEGDRKITVSLQLNNVDSTQLNNRSLQNAFDVYITGEKSWLSYTVSPSLSSDNVLTFSFKVPETEKAVIDYNVAIHGYSYNTKTPIVQVLLRANNANIGYKDFKNVTLQTAVVAVEVSNITSLTLESDSGTLDPKKAFLPFGPQPTQGSRFMVGYAEAFSKKLSQVSIKVKWKDAPSDFAKHYSKYGEVGNNGVTIDIGNRNIIVVNNSYFTAKVAFKDSNISGNPNSEKLFEPSNALSEHTFTFSQNTPPSVSSSIKEGLKISALNATGSFWAMQEASKYVLAKPRLMAFQYSEELVSPQENTPAITPETRAGFITFSLEQDFLHTIYRQKYVQNVMTYSKQAGDTPSPIILNEPYTPTIQNISLSYQAHSDTVNISSNSLDDFVNPDLDFFHITYFGQMREHGYQRQQIEAQIKAGISTTVPLLPTYNNAGELLIGLSQLNPGNSVSVLFQVAEGSANPDLPSEDLYWFVLCDNYWKQLSRAEVVLDTTNQLLASGIIQFVIPPEATAHNTILPSSLIWIKAAIKIQPTIPDNVTAVCQLIDVAANAVEVQFVDGNNDRKHLLTALKPNKITKLKNGLSAIKAVKQPYASFGGSAVETDKTFSTRVSERLRHKNRCLTAWDYERIILEAFPKVHQVKCIPHAKENSWLAPGHILIVVIPDLKNKNVANPLAPKVDADTISRINTYVQKRAGMQVNIKVKNPNYQKIKVDFKVEFYLGYEFNYYKTLLEEAIIEFLSPWAYQGDRHLSFGGKIYKSVLLDFVEDLPYVDYVTDFRMYSAIAETTNYNDINEVQPMTPDAILVSDSTHIINPALRFDSGTM